MAMSTNSKMVFEFLKENNNVDLTAADVAEALSLEKRQIDGIFTSAIQRKGYGVRVPGEIELEDGTHNAVKWLHLADEGMALDLDAADAE